MANKVLIQEMDATPEQITFRDSTDFSPTAANDLRHVTAADQEVDLDMTSVADGAARQSDKVDLGEHRSHTYGVRCAVELAATPTAGDVIEFYWAPSAHSTAATGNLAGTTGSDAAYTGLDSDLDNSVLMLMFIGVHVCTDDPTTTVQTSFVGFLTPPTAYGSLVVKNESGAAFHSDAVETHVVFDPLIVEVQ